MFIIIQCILIGFVSMLLCLIASFMISNEKITLNDTIDIVRSPKYSILRRNLIISFIIGAIAHYVIVKCNLTGLYCQKQCLDNICYDVCIKKI